MNHFFSFFYVIMNHYNWNKFPLLQVKLKGNFELYPNFDENTERYDVIVFS